MFRLKGSDRPLLITAGVSIGDAGTGVTALEAVFDTRHPIPRIASEEAGNALLESGVDVRVVRLPQVHDPVKQGLISPFIWTACEKCVVAKGLRFPARSLSVFEAPAHFGWMAMFAGLDLIASGDWTREQLSWMPTGPSLIADLEAMRYDVPTAVA